MKLYWRVKRKGKWVMEPAEIMIDMPGIEATVRYPEEDEA